MVKMILNALNHNVKESETRIQEPHSVFVFLSDRDSIIYQ